MLKQTAKKLEELFELSPLDLNAPTEVNNRMKDGLARLYGDPGIKSYLEHCVQIANKELLLKADTTEKVVYLRGKIITLMSILETAKTWYMNQEKLNDITKNYRTGGVLL